MFIQLHLTTIRMFARRYLYIHLCTGTFVILSQNSFFLVKCHHSVPLRFAYGFSNFTTCFLISFLQDLNTLQELFKILGQQLPVGKIVGQRSFVTCLLRGSIKMTYDIQWKMKHVLFVAGSQRFCELQCSMVT